MNLARSQYLGGASPSTQDAEYLNKIKPHAAHLSPLTHPHSFAWYGLTVHYSEDVVKKWPEHKAAAAATKKAEP